MALFFLLFNGAATGFFIAAALAGASPWWVAGPMAGTNFALSAFWFVELVREGA